MPEQISIERMVSVLDGLSKAYKQLCDQTGKDFYKSDGTWYSHARHIVDNAKQEAPVIEHE